jgi:hypothetical protein
MYVAGALNTYIDDLRRWIKEKEASVEQHKGRSHLVPVLEDLRKHIDYTKSLLVKAETFLAEKEAGK